MPRTAREKWKGGKSERPKKWKSGKVEGLKDGGARALL
jgi:hypothetical protein